MIHKPALLLADEPTGNLHSAQAKEIMELFQRLNEEGTTIVQVTHSEENAACGTRTIELRDGWLTKDTAGLVENGCGCEVSWTCCRFRGWAGLSLTGAHLDAQAGQTLQAPVPALRLDIPHSDNPIRAYTATLVPQPNLANSPRVMHW